ncbi:uncharacterized protein LOC108680661 [Hyalella azteca]|uniref:Uncharacterized protein LOC108680661 n=1 Tax=Hyalella azteca TaxID=294128 RepID=A0A8B7PGB0_HYAAZ|nr:uncharacterized protein LOC108680661 [Hyalella azteca]
MTYNTENMLVMTVTTFITSTILTTYSNPVAAATSALQPQLAEIHRLPKTLQEVLSRGLTGSDPHGPEHEGGFKVVMGQPRPGESPIYYIKLPPTPRFYSYSPPYKNRIGKQIPMNFTINGKPKKVYHWNLPYRKKVAEYRRLLSAPFHPFNHRSSADTFGTFITKQELAVPKPITDLALPSLNTNPIRNTELKTDDSEDNVETKIFESRNVRRKLNSDVIVEHEIGEKESKKLLATETSATNTAGGHSSPQTDLKTPAVSIDKQGRDIEKPPSINGEVETRFQTPLTHAIYKTGGGNCGFP